LQAMSEAFKAAPVQYQKIMMPHLMGLLDVPNRDEIIKAIREQEGAPDPENELKNRELDLKQALNEAMIKKIVAESVSSMVTAMYSATQAGMQIAGMPQIAPIADQILGSAGMPDANAAPLIAQPAQAAMPPVVPAANTSPMFPPRPESPGIGVDIGIEQPGAQI